MTKREREYHYEKKVWKAFVKLSSEPGGPHVFYDPSLKPSFDWEPQHVFGLIPTRDEYSKFNKPYDADEIKEYHEDEFPKWSEPPQLIQP